MTGSFSEALGVRLDERGDCREDRLESERGVEWSVTALGRSLGVLARDDFLELFREDLREDPGWPLCFLLSTEDALDDFLELRRGSRDV